MCSAHGTTLIGCRHGRRSTSRTGNATTGKPSWCVTLIDATSWELQIRATNANPQSLQVPHLLDAARVSDGELVILKRILKSEHPYEVEITKSLSSEPLASDPRNHCVRLYDVLEVPNEDDMVILVLPLLRRYDSPPFETVEEAIDFFSQVFEVRCCFHAGVCSKHSTRLLQGLQFMHHHHVAHR